MSAKTADRLPGVATTPLRALGDAALVRLVARGSDTAFATIYKRHHQDLYRYCRSITHDPEDARDALQNAMLNAFQAMRQPTAKPRKLRPWLFRIARNEAISMLRRRPPPSAADPEALGVPDPAPEARGQLMELLDELKQLSEQRRSALLMRELSGLSYEEIGATLGCSAAAARQSAFEARTALRAGRRELGALFPGLPAAPAAAVLQAVLGAGGGAAGAGAAAGLAGSAVAGGSALAGAGIKALATGAAIIAAAGAIAVERGGGAAGKRDRPPAAEASKVAGPETDASTLFTTQLYATMHTDGPVRPHIRDASSRIPAGRASSAELSAFHQLRDAAGWQGYEGEWTGQTTSWQGEPPADWQEQTSSWQAEQEEQAAQWQQQQAAAQQAAATQWQEQQATAWQEQAGQWEQWQDWQQGEESVP